MPLTLLFNYFINISPIIAVIIFILSGLFIFLSVSVTIVAAQKIMSHHGGVISGVMQGFSWGIGAMCLAPLGYIGEKIGLIWILIIMSTIALITGIFALPKDVQDALSNKC